MATGKLTDVTGVLLAGGKSTRMGEDKRFLQVGEQTLFHRSLAVLRSVFEQVLVVIAQDSPPLDEGVPVLRDLVPDCGSLGGLYTGLKQATTSCSFVVACDMPFLDPAAVRSFVESKGDADVMMAKLDQGLQPMHAVYSKRCIPAIEAMIQKRDLKIQRLADEPTLRVHLVPAADLRNIDPEGRSFLNVNTPADLRAARALLSKQKDRPSS